MLYFLLLLLSISNSTWASYWEHNFELHHELRNFNNDESGLTRDNSYSIKFNSLSKWKNNSLTANISASLRRDPSGHREADLLQEFWIRKEFNDFSITLGSQLLDWTALEAFHPVDVINARNLDSNFEQPEKIGEWILNLEIPNEEAVWNIYYMPFLQTQKFPKFNSRLSLNNSHVISNKIMNKSGELLSDKTVEQFGIRFEKSLDEMDYSVHYINHYDRQQPTVYTQVPSLGVHLGLSKVEQLGGTITYISAEYSLKLETAYRNYKTDFESIHTATNFPNDHTALAIGLEFPKQLNHGAELTYLLEIQAILGLNRLERSQINIFQRDILLGARFSRNDIHGTELLASTIIDLERSTEILSQFNFSRRIKDDQKYQLAIRFIHAKANGTGDFSGLKSFDGDVQITGSLIHYF